MTANKHDVEHLIRQAQVKLPGSSLAGIKGELYDTLNEFFDKSSTWTEALPVTIEPNTVDYQLTPTNGQIIRLAGVLDANSLPVPANMPDFGVLHLQNIYNSEQVVNAVVVINVVQPDKKCKHEGIPEIPDWVLSVYGVTILDGLLGRMMGQKSKTYSDEALGVYHTKRFNDGTAMARVAKLRRSTIGSQAWSFPQSWRMRGQRGGVSTGGSDRSF